MTFASIGLKFMCLDSCLCRLSRTIWSDIVGYELRIVSERFNQAVSTDLFYWWPDLFSTWACLLSVNIYIAFIHPPLGSKLQPDGTSHHKDLLVCKGWSLRDGCGKQFTYFHSFFIIYSVLSSPQWNSRFSQDLQFFLLLRSLQSTKHSPDFSQLRTQQIYTRFTHGDIISIMCSVSSSSRVVNVISNYGIMLPVLYMNWTPSYRES